jgi:hypothetical protein
VCEDVLYICFKIQVISRQTCVLSQHHTVSSSSHTSLLEKLVHVVLLEPGSGSGCGSLRLLGRLPGTPAHGGGLRVGRLGPLLGRLGPLRQLQLQVVVVVTPTHWIHPNQPAVWERGPLRGSVGARPVPLVQEDGPDCRQCPRVGVSTVSED